MLCWSDDDDERWDETGHLIWSDGQVLCSSLLAFFSATFELLTVEVVKAAADDPIAY